MAAPVYSISDVEGAIQIVFGQTGGDLRERATAYLNQLKASPEGWKFCVERFSATPYPEVKFWCLQTLHEVVRAYYTQLDAQSQGAIKGALLTWLQRDCTVESAGALPPFLRNKLAQVLVAIVQLEYPAVWPTFFRDLVAAARQGPGLADMLCRVMVAVDEDVISLEIPRSQEEAKLSMHLKDSMRDRCIADVAEGWYELALAHRASRPQLAAFVLTTAARYVHWIDIGLVANDKFMPLLLELMEAPHSGLRAAATDCVIEVVSKRMEPAAKVQLVENLKIVPACAAWSRTLAAAVAAAAAGGGEGEAAAAAAMLEDEELIAKVAKLLATMAGEVMDALKRVENSVISMQAVGFEVDDDAGREATAVVEAATRLLEQLTPAVLQAFACGLEAVAMPLVPFINAYVARLKMLARRNQTLPPNAALHLRSVLEGVAAAARYPDESANEGAGPDGVPPGEAEALAAREEQWEVEERRRELFVVLKNVAKLSLGDALAFVGQQLQAVAQHAAAANGGAAAAAAANGGGSGGAGGSGSPTRRGGGGGGCTFQEVEIAVAMLYELGEGAPDDSLKPGSGALGQLALLLLGGGGALPRGRHRLVALAAMEAATRYARVVQQSPAAIPGALSLFLEPGRGLGHPSPDVSTRACYLFSRLVKQLRSSLRPYAGDILASLQPHLVRVATVPPPAAAAAAGGAAAAAPGGPGAAAPSPAALAAGGRESSSAKQLAPSTSPVDDRLYVFDAVGLLLGQEEIPADQQSGALSGLLQPLIRQIEGNLQPAAAGAAAGAAAVWDDAAAARAPPAWLILQAMEAIARLNKGFKSDLVTRTRPQLGQMFLSCLEAAIQVPKALPGHKQLRARFIAFVHRLVECLLAAVLPYLPMALQVLMHGQADAQDTVDVLSLMTQLMTRFKEAMLQLVEAMLPQIVGRVNTLLGQEWDWSGRAAAPARGGAPAAAAAAAPAGAAPEQQQQQQQQRSGEGGGGAEVTATLEDVREKGELQRAYYSFLHGVAHQGLAAALLQAPPSVLDSVLSALTRGAASHVDPTVRRTCLQVFERLLAEWCANGEVVPGFKRFAMEQLGGEACVLGLLRASQGLDARDAATAAFVGEVAAALKLLYEKCGDEFAAHLCGRVLPSLDLPAEVQQELVRHVRESDSRQLRDCLRSVLLQANAAGGGQGGGPR
ncbi:exportin [Raphidocelis subcapitata]|uniref:Exportin-T n=1 Tax=Raphidocelis subcapitata TaxID=307507 RepID=A0A2V0NUT8_9CHLO|nr:exportin [Raphidocelis subcapitata]|eukprot:GBF91404.1 exportin [Raphidocelis subcapitata]